MASDNPLYIPTFPTPPPSQGIAILGTMEADGEKLFREKLDAVLGEVVADEPEHRREDLKYHMRSELLDTRSLLHLYSILNIAQLIPADDLPLLTDKAKISSLFSWLCYRQLLDGPDEGDVFLTELVRGRLIEIREGLKSAWGAGGPGTMVTRYLNIPNSLCKGFVRRQLVTTAEPRRPTHSTPLAASGTACLSPASASPTSITSAASSYIGDYPFFRALNAAILAPLRPRPSLALAAAPRSSFFAPPYALPTDVFNTPFSLNRPVSSTPLQNAVPIPHSVSPINGPDTLSHHPKISTARPSFFASPPRTAFINPFSIIGAVSSTPLQNAAVAPSSSHMGGPDTLSDGDISDTDSLFEELYPSTSTSSLSNSADDKILPTTLSYAANPLSCPESPPLASCSNSQEADHPAPVSTDDSASPSPMAGPCSFAYVPASAQSSLAPSPAFAPDEDIATSTALAELSSSMGIIAGIPSCLSPPTDEVSYPIEVVADSRACCSPTPLSLPPPPHAYVLPLLDIPIPTARAHRIVSLAVHGKRMRTSERGRPDAPTKKRKILGTQQDGRSSTDVRL